MTHRALSRIAFAEKPRPAIVPAETRPRLEWIAPEKLVVDTRYQREIGKRGEANIRRMVEGFDWSLFGVVTCVALSGKEGRGGGLYAIIDGQHRATAALMHPAVSLVPCWIVVADETAQARAFVGINAAVTQMSPIQLYHAGVAAGTPDAAGAEACAEAAGVTVMRYPLAREHLKAGQTLAAGTLRAMWKQHGPRVLEPALAVLALADADGAGLINMNTIKAMCGVLATRHLSDALTDALTALDLDKLEDAAQLASLTEGGGVARHFAAAISEALAEKGFSEKAPEEKRQPRRARRGVGSY